MEWSPLNKFPRRKWGCWCTGSCGVDTHSAPSFSLRNQEPVRKQALDAVSYCLFKTLQETNRITCNRQRQWHFVCLLQIPLLYASSLRSVVMNSQPQSKLGMSSLSPPEFLISPPSPLAAMAPSSLSDEPKPSTRQTSGQGQAGRQASHAVGRRIQVDSASKDRPVVLGYHALK